MFSGNHNIKGALRARPGIAASLASCVLAGWMAAGCSGAFFRVTPEEPATRPRTATPGAADSAPVAAAPAIPLLERLEPAATASDSAGVQRLMRLAMLWQTVRQHHPWAEDGVAWDAAVARAIPAVRAAGDAEALSDAIRPLLLDAFGDGVTGVELQGPREVTSARTDDARPRVEATWFTAADTVLLLRIAPASRYTRADSAVIADAMARNPALVAIDLRGEFGNAYTYHHDAVNALVERTGLASSLSNRSLELGQRQTRIVESPIVIDAGFLSGAMHRTDASQRFSVEEFGTLPAAARRATRTVVIVNRATALPQQLAAMVAAGGAWLVSEARPHDEVLVPSVLVSMGGNMLARVRTGDVLFPSNLNPRRVDRSVPWIARPVYGDSAAPSVRAAISLLRNAGPPQTEPRAARGGRAPVPGLAAWNSDTLPYPYLGARLLAAFKVWSVMRTQYAHRDAYDDDIDAVFERVIPRVEAAQNREQYARALADLVASFDDSQVRLQRRSGDSREEESSAPFRARVIEGRMIVTSLRPGTTAPGIAVGTEITAANGYPIAAWLQEHRRDVSASNDWTRMRDLAELMPRGAAGGAVFKVRDATGPERSVSVARTPVAVAPDAGSERTAERTAAPSRMIGEVAYVDLARLDADAAARAFAALGNARAVVIDLRGPLALPPEFVLARFAMRREFTAARVVSRPMSAPCIVPTLRDAARLCADERTTTPVVLRGDSANAFRGRVVVLIDERTQDAAERLALALEAGASATLVGSPSAGAAAPTVSVALPGNLTLHFPQTELRRADGGQLHRVGLTPSVDARPTVRGVRAGTDEVLDRAIAWIAQQLDGPRRRR